MRRCRHGWPWGWPYCRRIVAALAGVIISVPVLRCGGDYLAIVTLGCEFIKSIFNTLGITGGASGLTGIPMLTTYRNFTLVFILTVIVIIVVAPNLVRSRQGRAICAIRDNYIAAEVLVLKVSTYKVMAFVVSAFFAALPVLFTPIISVF